MAEHGVARRSGAGTEHLREIAPLLAVEGFDLDNLPEDTDVDALNAALARANERRNTEQFE
ncbi:hypothetical protein SAMN04487783_1175 [Agrococcus baldri]|uniref:Uncharacterized protein n=1 Tax=Agrococcus baldri TaxID=153730 RepID=A0AA94HLY4_9MICO|nr:hypothetical protein [Agrococcus baldri]SFS08903.1 hypothetical protein SAMN04487783_1175 [Agrococcus baldri]